MEQHRNANGHGVIADAPSSEVYGPLGGRCAPPAASAWTLHGKPLPYANTILADAIRFIATH